jgi:diacylglycerol kinase family enzyme
LDRLELQHTSYITNAPKDAGRIGQDIVRAQEQPEEPIKVVVAGGDGTAHELIEGIVGLSGQPAKNRIWQLIILPLGTVSVLECSLEF